MADTICEVPDRKIANHWESEARLNSRRPGTLKKWRFGGNSGALKLMAELLKIFIAEGAARAAQQAKVAVLNFPCSYG
ncbi:hypothetical protein P5673_003294 [Acropora cervicornis]|uniref:Uncharacterized protein n=1 Tax=Acropora cervicornis TaxID=6130 RepID=A0AAD9R2F9_ACRCE|nr:hypothetical protein P5673_003294 [Acropora cervicornis]